MKLSLLPILAIVLMGSLFCSRSAAQESTARSSHIDIEFVIEHQRDGKTRGSVAHPRNTKELEDSPLVQTFTGLNGRSAVVTIGYVGYAGFQVAEAAKGVKIKPGHVFAVQVFSGEDGVTIKTAKENTSTLVIYHGPPQVIYKNEMVSVTIRRKEE